VSFACRVGLLLLCSLLFHCGMYVGVASLYVHKVHADHRACIQQGKGD
jgi:hypothetical protein